MNPWLLATCSAGYEAVQSRVREPVMPVCLVHPVGGAGAKSFQCITERRNDLRSWRFSGDERRALRRRDGVDA